MIPRPFSRLVLSIGAPVAVEKQSDDEVMQREIEILLNQVTERADEKAGIINKTEV